MRIGALAAAAGMSTKTIRFYEQAGVLPAPPRTASGYRDYPPQFTDRLAFVRAAQCAGLTLADIREVLAVMDGGDRCGHAAAVVDKCLRGVEERIEELTWLRVALRRIGAGGGCSR